MKTTQRLPTWARVVFALGLWIAAMSAASLETDLRDATRQDLEREAATVAYCDSLEAVQE